MCTDNVANLYLAILENVLRFDLRACNFKKFPGAMPPDPLEIACSTSWLSDLPDQGNAMLNCFPTHKNGPPKL